MFAKILNKTLCYRVTINEHNRRERLILHRAALPVQDGGAGRGAVAGALAVVWVNSCKTPQGSPKVQRERCFATIKFSGEMMVTK